MDGTPRLLAAAASISLLALLGCGGTGDFSFPIEGSTPPGASAPEAGGSAPIAIDGGATSTVDATLAPPGDAATPSDAAQAPSADATRSVDAALGVDAGDVLGGLRGITSTCTVASNGAYATDRSATAAVDVCKLDGAFFWTADFAIDCDGQQTSECNPMTDSTFSAQTSFTQSNGQPLIASALPYVVIPLPSSRFDYTKENVQPGALAIVVYGTQVVYGVFGDEGPTGVIGEASYATAVSLGLDPNPNTGGTSGPVTYIVLTGKGAVVSPIESHAAAVTLAATLVEQLIQNN